MIFNPTRDQARQFIFETWQKFKNQQILTPLEMKMLDILAIHPEYHSLLDSQDSFLDKDFSPEDGTTNPFLHLNLHLAVQEMLDIDQPKPIKKLYDTLCLKYQDEHQALHVIIERIGEMIYKSQRYGTPFDPKYLFEGFYLD